MSERTILCVDDEPNILQSLKRLLRREPYALLTAGSAEEALTLLAQHDVRIIISDHRMAGMTGTALLQKVSELHPDIIRIMLSGYSEPGAIIEAVNMGQIHRFLAKPWNDEELKLTIRQCLDQYDLAERNRLLAGQVSAQNEDLKRLNRQLEEVITERTRALEVSQEILDILPIPVIGISKERVVAFTNSALRRSPPSLRRIRLGNDIGEDLPPPLVRQVDNCLQGRGAVAPVSGWVDGHHLRFEVEPLRNGTATRGCLVLVYEQGGEDIHRPPGKTRTDMREEPAPVSSCSDMAPGRDRDDRR